MKLWIIALCVIVVAGAGVYAYLASTNSAPTPVVSEPVRVYSVALEESYADGVNSIDGTITLDTPCQSLEATSTTVAGNIRIDITVAAPEGICLQRSEARTFSIEAEAPEEALIAVFVNGVAATIE